MWVPCHQPTLVCLVGTQLSKRKGMQDKQPILLTAPSRRQQYYLGSGTSWDLLDPPTHTTGVRHGRFGCSLQNVPAASAAHHRTTGPYRLRTEIRIVEVGSRLTISARRLSMSLLWRERSPHSVARSEERATAQ
jgi:hypothetical protein